MENSLQELVRDRLPSKSMLNDKLQEFMKLMNDEDCRKKKEDCRDVVSPCCSSVVATVFGTLPLKVKCSKCGNEFSLRDLVLTKS